MFDSQINNSRGHEFLVDISTMFQLVKNERMQLNSIILSRHGDNLNMQHYQYTLR